MSSGYLFGSYNMAINDQNRTKSLCALASRMASCDTSGPCPFHPSQTLTKPHSIHCLNMRRRLQSLEIMVDPLSLLLNKLPHRTPHSFKAVLPWFLQWPTICTTLHDLDYLCHDRVPPSPPPYLGQCLLDWLPNVSRWCLLHLSLFLSPQTFLPLIP
jgi:hypothetical protein